MSRLRLVALALPLAALACTGSDTSFTAPITVTGAHDAHTPQNFQTHLTGDAERPIPRETQAQGNAKFQLSKDGETMHYKLIISNIENAFMAHIHLGPVDGSGGIVVWLRPVDRIPLPATMQGRHDGVWAEGSFTANDFVGVLGTPAQKALGMQALLTHIRNGNAYVNVHTNNVANDPANNTGPGDFPGGEVRGQIDHGNGM